MTTKRKKAKSKKSKPNLKHWLVNKVRRLSYQWPPRKEAIKKARLERGIYLCNICQGKFGPKEIQLDHIEPVIHEEDGFIDWNNYLERLFCAEEGFQVLCKPCHNIKSYYENEIRRQVKKENRKDDNDGDI